MLRDLERMTFQIERDVARTLIAAKVINHVGDKVKKVSLV